MHMLAGEDVALDVKDICAKFTTDIIGITAYGMRFQSLTDPNCLVRRAGEKIFAKNYKRHVEFLSTLLVPSIVDLFKFKFFGEEASTFLGKLFKEAMSDRLQSGIKRADLIDFLIDLKKEQDAKPATSK